MDIDMSILRMLEREKEISFDVLVEVIEQALLTAYHKTPGAREKARVELDRKTGHVTVLAAEPPGYFEEAAVESFKGALFAPGQRNGRPVKSRIPVEVTFEAKTDSTKSP